MLLPRLTRLHLDYRRVLEVIVIQNCVEDETITAKSLATIDRVIPEEEHRTLAEVRIHNNCAFRNGAALVEKAVEQQRFGIRESQNHLGP